MTDGNWLQFRPLGGVRQIGANMMALSAPQEEILFDAGMAFPFEDVFDIDFLIPDYSFLHNPGHLIITHGHEDHIGGVVPLIQRFKDLQIHASPLAATLIRKKFEDFGIKHNIKIFRENDILSFNHFDIYPIHVNHSIPQTYGLLIKSKKFSFSAFYLSDFKYDDSTPYEPPCDFDRLRALSKSSKRRVLFIDSTNISDDLSSSSSENDLLDPLDNIIRQASGRVFITLFASNIHRLQSIINLAEKHKRKIVPCGRSVNNFLEVGRELQLIQNVGNILIELDNVPNDKKNLIILLSGPQGDFKGALRRVAYGEDSKFTPKPDDSFVFSCKIIPGNERKIRSIINKLSEAGSTIFLPQQHMIHASGHSGTKDIKILLDCYSPTEVIPIHGESYSLRKHAEFINKNYPHVQTHLIHNFDTIKVHGDLPLSIQPQEEPHPLFIHGKNILLERSAVAQRRKMATRGVVFLSILQFSKRKNDLKIMCQFAGLPQLAEQHNKKITSLVQQQIQDLKSQSKTRKKEILNNFIKRYFENVLGYRPEVFIHVID
jgi:ribonuclease J